MAAVLVLLSLGVPMDTVTGRRNGPNELSLKPGG